MAELRIAVIADGDSVPRFGLEALDAVRGADEIALFSCTNTRTRRNVRRHGLYYALNMATVRNRMTRQVPLSEGRKRIASVTTFASGWDGAWQTLPADIVERLSGYDVVVKFGMGLLRIPPPESLPVPILSFHHGDPDRYRGRPAGFWEIWEGAPAMGQIVQILGNRLDAGAVVAFAETHVYPHSYRATLLESYRHSRLLLDPAIRNALEGKALPKPCTGRNYRLPSNLTVARFLLRMARRWLARAFYGLAREKSWQVSVVPAPAERLAEVACGAAFPATGEWRTIPVDPDYTFYADPFFSSAPPGILVEALSRRTGLGEIVLVAGGRHARVSDGPGHFSYPCTIAAGGIELVVPEISGWSPPRAYRIEDGRLRETAALDVEGAERLVDPTLFQHEGRLYLFASPPEAGTNILCLWSAESIDAPFRLHPASPVLVSPRGGRMAGAVRETGGRLLRFGQDGTRAYGDGILAFEIEALTPTDYRERPIGTIRFADRRGPHTLNARDGEWLFDWYVDRLSPLAGVRRLRAIRRERAATRARVQSGAAGAPPAQFDAAPSDRWPAHGLVDSDRE